MIIFVAKAGFLIGQEFSIAMGVPMIGIETVRDKGNDIKKIISPFIRKMPNFVRNILITTELKSNIHLKNANRSVAFIESSVKNEYLRMSNILIVDDSIDTGMSILAVKRKVEKRFANADIKIAGFNVWDKSRKIIETDFFLYKNTIIKAPMSMDSAEYDTFLCEYAGYLDKVRKGNGNGKD